VPRSRICRRHLPASLAVCRSVLSRRRDHRGPLLAIRLAIRRSQGAGARADPRNAMRPGPRRNAQRHRSFTGGLHGHAVKIAAAGAVRRPLLRMLVRRKHLKACSGSRGCARRCRTNGYNSVGLPDEVNKHCIAHRGRKRERQGGSAQLPGNAGGFANLCRIEATSPQHFYRKLCRSDAPGSPAPGRAFGRRLVARGADLDPSRPWLTLQIFKSAGILDRG
jgi:hypothetical protein